MRWLAALVAALVAGFYLAFRNMSRELNQAWTGAPADQPW